ncbi:translation initiation factor IF-2, partial [Dissulfurirhabdus thermomarina]
AEGPPAPEEPEAPPPGKSAAPEPEAAKTFVKILDHPRIVLPEPAAPPPRSRRTQAPGGEFEATGQPLASDIPPTDKKGKKKGKRVVQISTITEDRGRKRAPGRRMKERKKPIKKLLVEEIDLDAKGAPVDAGLSLSLSARKSAKRHRGGGEAGAAGAPKEGKRKILIHETIPVGELAKRMSVKAADVIMKLMGLGVMATANQAIDYDAAVLVASEFGYEVEKRAVAEDLLQEEEVQGGEPVPRPPVVTVMGHVDHGKTSLLDAIRKADVVSQEAGGITQHIGAYHVRLPAGQEVVFLDTPGHAAFTAMRARGAKVTDIVILIVAADDGVMAQTREAIDHARAADVPIIVAINKIDKPDANPDRVKKELAELGLIPEEWGGQTIFVEISAKKKIGIEALLEMLALQAEVMELKADPVRPARGHVIEARLDKGRGPVATVLVTEGTLRTGDAVVCGLHHGRVRAMLNDKGVRVEEAGPSIPVEIQGLSGVPEAGDELAVLSDEKKAREVAEYRQMKAREAELAKAGKVTLEGLFERMQEQELKELNIVLKADVQGSVEALGEALRKMSTPEIRVNIVHSGIGAISESDILLASASGAIVIGFNVRPNPQAKALAEKEEVDVRFYDVIYQALDEVRNSMVGLLEPVFEEKVLGQAEVRETFHVPKVGTVAGCFVQEGVVRRNAQARLFRDNVVVYNGKIASLRRFKDDVKEVQAGYECGIGLERFNDIKVGDIIEVYRMEEVAPELETAQPGGEGQGG